MPGKRARYDDRRNQPKNKKQRRSDWFKAANLDEFTAKYALIFGYVGTGYNGMQKQEGDTHSDSIKTIENDLEKALISAEIFPDRKAISESDWSRVGRTDSGVHAASQVVTFKISNDKPDWYPTAALTSIEEILFGSHELSLLRDDEDIIKDRIFNERVKSWRCQREQELKNLITRHLGDSSVIQIHSVARVSIDFDARSRATQRRYEYCIPLGNLRFMALHDTREAFHDFFKHQNLPEDIKKASHEAYVPIEQKAAVVAAIEKCEIEKLTEDDNNDITEILGKWRAEMLLLRRAYSKLNIDDRREIWDKSGETNFDRTDLLPYLPVKYCSYRPSEVIPNRSEIIEKLSSALKVYEGTFFWYQYTSRMAVTDSSCLRKINDVEISEGWNEDFIIIRIRGQSFLLNQIRKMISLAIESVVGNCPTGVTHKWLTKKPVEAAKRHIHLVPGEGLLLERAYFDLNNKDRVIVNPQMDLIGSNTGKIIDLYKINTIYREIQNIDKTP